MTGERNAGSAYFGAYRPDLAALAGDAEADDAGMRNPISLAERIDPYGGYSQMRSAQRRGAILRRLRELAPRVTRHDRITLGL